ncbi:MAG: hypothetical protein ABID04_00925 [Patescibacteria group bacterium]
MDRTIIGLTQQPERAGEFSPEVLSWMTTIRALSLTPPANPERTMTTAQECWAKGIPLPVIITLCPAIKNLAEPNERGQSRELVPLTPENQRLQLFVQELLNFHSVCKQTLGIPIEIMFMFVDLLEDEAEAMFTNAEQMPTIAKESLVGVRQTFQIVDQSQPGKFQIERFRVPKISLRSSVLQQAGQAGFNHEKAMRQATLEMLTPGSGTFDLLVKHLRLSKDSPLVETGFQTIASARTIWTRVEFLLAEFIADGQILPEIMKSQNRKVFQGQSTPPPIFVCSSTRSGGIQMEMDGFCSTDTNGGAIAIFKNVGRWESPPHTETIG